MRETPTFWYSDLRGFTYYLLLPVSWIFCLVVWARQRLYKLGLLRSVCLAVPVVVVGNITTGGTGKTPLVIWMANFLKEKGFKPGIVSRGYGGNATSWPQQVRADGDYVAVGDEAVMIAARTECPMAVGPKRAEAAVQLIEHHNVDVIISDDGLQHYAMQRDIEIAVVDGVRRFGNGQCLPAGPLREKPSRLDTVDIIVVNGEGERREHPMTISSPVAVNMQDGKVCALKEFSGMAVNAIAGVGNPDRFFKDLISAGLEVNSHAFPDHHIYNVADVQFDNEHPIFMTEKDAVKCVRFVTENFWCVPVSAELGNAFGQRLLMLLDKSRLDEEK